MGCNVTKFLVLVYVRKDKFIWLEVQERWIEQKGTTQIFVLYEKKHFVNYVFGVPLFLYTNLLHFLYDRMSNCFYFILQIVVILPLYSFLLIHNSTTPYLSYLYLYFRKLKYLKLINFKILIFDSFK